jgi:hypothetical protein
MKLPSGLHVGLMSLPPVRRSQAQRSGGKQRTILPGSSAIMRKHFDDTVYGDFLQHQPPVKELVSADTIDLWIAWVT